MISGLTTHEERVYQQMREFYQRVSSLKDIIANIFLPSRRREMSLRLEEIQRLTNLPDVDTVYYLLRAGILYTLRSKTLDELEAYIQKDFEDAVAQKGVKIDTRVMSAVRFSQIAAATFWELRHPAA